MIKVLIFGKGNYREEDLLIKTKEDKENYRFKSNNKLAGKIPSDKVTLDAKGNRTILAFKDGNKFTWFKINGEEAADYTIPEVEEYLAKSVDKYAARIDSQGFWQKHGAAFVIFIAMVAYGIGSYLQYRASKGSYDAINKQNAILQQIGLILNQTEAAPLP